MKRVPWVEGKVGGKVRREGEGLDIFFKNRQMGYQKKEAATCSRVPRILFRCCLHVYP